jgi:hypothetical protein
LVFDVAFEVLDAFCSRGDEEGGEDSKTLCGVLGGEIHIAGPLNACLLGDSVEYGSNPFENDMKITINRKG